MGLWGISLAISPRHFNGSLGDHRGNKPKAFQWVFGGSTRQSAQAVKPITGGSSWESGNKHNGGGSGLAMSSRQ